MTKSPVTFIHDLAFEDLPADDFRRRQPRFQGENFQKNLDLVRHVEDVASRKGCTPAQLVLAWLLHQGDDIVPIPGTTRVDNLEEKLQHVAAGRAISFVPASVAGAPVSLVDKTGSRSGSGGQDARLVLAATDPAGR